MGAIAQFTDKLKINKPTVSFWRCKKNEASLQEFVWIVTWVNYLRDSLLRADSGCIPNNTHLSFLTRAILEKSPNNIPFVLRHSFTLSIKRSSLSGFAPKKNTRLISRIHTVHIHVIQVEIQSEETHALVIVLNYCSYCLSLFSFSRKKTSNVTRWRRRISVKCPRQNAVVIFEQKYSK